MASFKTSYDALVGFFGSIGCGPKTLEVDQGGFVALPLQIDTTVASRETDKYVPISDVKITSSRIGSGVVNLSDGTTAPLASFTAEGTYPGTTFKQTMIPVAVLRFGISTVTLDRIVIIIAQNDSIYGYEAYSLGDITASVTGTNTAPINVDFGEGYPADSISMFGEKKAIALPSTSPSLSAQKTVFTTGNQRILIGTKVINVNLKFIQQALSA
ncbi:hypothetical protein YASMINEVIRUS_1142 [Yasminevirus sp. GU-2018]|uniref:Uncharacterized protein n=1 Tax=Yasminevirus sp. GU-2018 TaxID=2420051 RepID=A0A5K0UAC1_9VIRU|nr:hypothetical protein YASMINEVIRUS_1142 [Yasminevirus sp. GU-2018]